MILLNTIKTAQTNR